MTRGLFAMLIGRASQTGRARPALPRCLGEDAGIPFTFYGHRLGSLYRATLETRISFIFFKIRKILPQMISGRMPYLEKGESQWVAR